MANLKGQLKDKDNNILFPDTIYKKILWVNDSPDTSFASQTITVLDDNEFDYILLDYDAVVPYQNYMTYLFRKPSKTYQLPYCQILEGTTKRLRYITRNDSTHYTFSNGVDGNSSVDNSLCVPLRIIGIKFI